MFKNSIFSLFILLSLCFSSFANAAIPETERTALLSLYQASNGADWTFKDGWSGDAGTECSWYGVVCSDNDEHVIKLYLGANNLQGTLPDEIFALDQLQVLNLQQNQLYGNLPSGLSDFTQLTELNLRNNQFTGSIPEQIGELLNLRQLLLSNNQLSGNIPANLGKLSNLEDLFLNENTLSGELPEQLGQLQQLINIDLRANQITGSIPTSFGDLHNLQRLVINSNQLSGNIPAEIGQLQKLSSLRLGDNQLSGEIPEQLGNLTEMTWLQLDNNALTGPIPDSFVNFGQLLVLQLAHNQLSGEIPSGFDNFTQLRHLTLNDNCLDLGDFDFATPYAGIRALDLGGQDSCSSNPQQIPLVATAKHNRITIPAVNIEGKYYRVTLTRFEYFPYNQGWFWFVSHLELIEDTIPATEHVIYDPFWASLTFSKIHYRDHIMSATMYRYRLPNDDGKIYFQYNPNP